MSETNPSRRDFVKRAAYVAPAILTLAAAPAYAKSGSEKWERGPRGPEGGDSRGRPGVGPWKSGD